MNNNYTKYFFLTALYTFAIGGIAVEYLTPPVQLVKIQQGTPRRPTVLPTSATDIDQSKTIKTRPMRNTNRAMRDAMQSAMISAATAHIQSAMNTKRNK